MSRPMPHPASPRGRPWAGGTPPWRRLFACLAVLLPAACAAPGPDAGVSAPVAAALAEAPRVRAAPPGAPLWLLAWREACGQGQPEPPAPPTLLLASAGGEGAARPVPGCRPRVRAA